MTVLPVWPGVTVQCSLYWSFSVCSRKNHHRYRCILQRRLTAGWGRVAAILRWPLPSTTFTVTTRYYRTTEEHYRERARPCYGGLRMRMVERYATGGRAR